MPHWRNVSTRAQMKILLAVDGSKNSLDAVNCVIEHATIPVMLVR